MLGAILKKRRLEILEVQTPEIVNEMDIVLVDHEYNKFHIAKTLLHDELILNEHCNRHKIRQLCINNPGLISALAIRFDVWSLLLLGRTLSSVDDSCNYNIESDGKLCFEHQVRTINDCL